jgi:hypothetical protein
MPVAWMISSNATQETVTFFLFKLRAASPHVKPKWVMSDKDRAQMNSIRRIFPEAQLLLCWWHVLHAWQQHFVTVHHPELWELLKAWIRIPNQSEFDEQWERIKVIGPPSVVAYLETEWLGEQKLWSAVARTGRSIRELGDTNMLVEAYVASSPSICLSSTILDGTISSKTNFCRANGIAASTTYCTF